MIGAGTSGVRAALPAGSRIVALDLARTAALAGMIVYHFAYDLQLFGHLAPGTTFSGGWRALAIAVASSFLFLAGVSLHIAHGAAIRWRPFLRRLAVIGAAAGLVSGATFIAFPDSFVYFGILHAIAVASVLGLIFLRLPPALTLAVALACYLGRNWVPVDRPWLDWTGLTATPRPSVDFEPVLPWIAPFLIGLAAARLADGTAPWQRLRRRPGGPVLRALAWPGRHSLLIYLAHQPVLIGLVWASSMAQGRPGA